MKKPKDYTCRYANYNRLTPEFVAPLGLKIPDLYRNAEDMVKVARFIKEENGGEYCKLPFDTSVEAENMGAHIRYDESSLGPRKAEDVLEDPADFLGLPALDPSKGRLAEVLRACGLLAQQGEIPALEVRGFFDVMNSLVDLQKVLMAWAMKKEVMVQVSEKMRRDLVTFFKAGQDAGCRFFMYSDASGGLSILGPRYAKKLMEAFTYPLMKDLEGVLGEGTVLQLCPKSAFMLTGFEMARWKEKRVDKEVTYFDAYLSEPEIRFTGQRCSREISVPSGGRVHYLELE